MFYCPEQGEIILLSLDPTMGREQKGKRPALVISKKTYNQKSLLMIAVPITSKEKGYPFEVRLPDVCKTQGVILTDQVRSLDWKARQIKFLEVVPEEVFDEVLA
ncbi:growth inhibitor [Leptolyngbyaceae cyanobacterium JSC-12]|nr:growth inhibitor [Leptolyngbyaceae cyanobacterium JSC-12]